MKEILERHTSIALQFSGGKDSLALLYLMQPYWDNLTVYWLDTGVPFPETLEYVEEVIKIVPHFKRVRGSQPEVIAQFGIPSDLVPGNSTAVGISSRDGGTLIQDRYSCCMRSRMLPLHDRMKKDGITLVIRGQKASDAMRAPIKSGAIEDGIEYLFPLENWDDAKVFSFLKEKQIRVPRFYEIMNTSPDCMTCSAYWEDGRAHYLQLYHPEAYEEYQRRLNAISAATAEAIVHFNVEIG